MHKNRMLDVLVVAVVQLDKLTLGAARKRQPGTLAMIDSVATYLGALGGAGTVGFVPTFAYAAAMSSRRLRFDIVAVV